MAFCFEISSYNIMCFILYSKHKVAIWLIVKALYLLHGIDDAKLSHYLCEKWYYITINYTVYAPRYFFQHISQKQYILHFSAQYVW